MVPSLLQDGRGLSIPAGYYREWLVVPSSRLALDGRYRSSAKVVFWRKREIASSCSHGVNRRNSC